MDAITCCYSGFYIWFSAMADWYLGAGDAKLLAAIVPMIQLNHLASVLLLIACFGGILAIVMWVLSRLTTRNTYKHVPYGVPISIGCWLGVIASIP
ncbi:A24 family peptidase [Vibrio algarum]|uniref:hypothetical protein n=1 Tax=Vibrio algarum TaxID=3020714 RepID=UPI00389A66F2